MHPAYFFAQNPLFLGFFDTSIYLTDNIEYAILYQVKEIPRSDKAPDFCRFLHQNRELLGSVLWRRATALGQISLVTYLKLKRIFATHGSFGGSMFAFSNIVTPLFYDLFRRPIRPQLMEISRPNGRREIHRHWESGERLRCSCGMDKSVTRRVEFYQHLADTAFPNPIRFEALFHTDERL